MIVLAVFLGGWLLFDGTRAFVTGDYTTPSSGEYAGQLGPWAGLVSSLGIEPRSTWMKVVHVLLGAVYLAAAAGLIGSLSWGRRALRVSAVAGLWYLPFGTLIGILLLILLYISRSRASAGA